MLDIYHRYAAIDKALRKSHSSAKQILEVGSAGCGYGRYFKPGEWDLTCIDIQSIPMKEQRKYPHIKFKRYDGKRLPFADKSFFNVICVDTLEHVPQEQRAHFIKELKRVCKGQIIMVFPHHKAAKEEERIRNIVRFVSRDRVKIQPLQEHLECILPIKLSTADMFNDGEFQIKKVRENLNLRAWIPLKSLSSLVFFLLKGYPKIHRPLFGVYKNTIFPMLNFGSGYSAFIHAERIS